MAEDLLPNPLTRRPLNKAARTLHPNDPIDGTPPTTVAVSPRTSTQNRVGPNRVRKSLYLPADIAAALSAEANRIHHTSQGQISKADAAGAIIRKGLDHPDEVSGLLP